MTDRRAKLASARLYLCTDGRGGGADLDAFLDAALSGGVDVVQLRDKHAEAREMLAVAERFRSACDRHGALFVVNDRVDLAIAAGADGLHLGQGDLPPDAARAMAGPHVLIGRSTHAPGEILAANDEPVDYMAVGPVFQTPTKPGRVAVGVELIEVAARDARRPWFAIGGLDSSTIGRVVAAGARRAVVVRALTQADDPARAAKELRAALERAPL